MTDRRALIVGSWKLEGSTQPSHQKVMALTKRWEAVCETLEFHSLTSRRRAATILHNPVRSDLMRHFEDASAVSGQTELLLYFVGHSTRSGMDDLQLILGAKKNGASQQNQTISLRRILEMAQTDAGIHRMVVILDTCHAGHAVRQLAMPAAGEILALLATGDGFAFDAEFSEGILRAFEEPLRKSDQRIDRLAGGVTYRKVFEFARKHVLTRGSRKTGQTPTSTGNYEGSLVRVSPPNVPAEFHPFAGERTVYGRLFRLISILCEHALDERELLQRVRSDDVFLLKRVDDGTNEYVSRERLSEYLDFLRAARWLLQPDGRYRLTEEGRHASHSSTFNRRVLDAIVTHVLPEELGLDGLDRVVAELIVDAIPASPINIRERAAMNGMFVELSSATRLALQLLPSTGRFTKGAADALYPAELGG